MPKYTYPLSNGKSLVLEGDTQPSDAEVESLAKEQGVSLVPAEEPGMLSRLGSGALDLIKNHPAQAGAMLGGLIAVPLTGGASIPAAVAAAGLGGAGGAGLGMIGGAVAGSPDLPTTAGGVVKEMAGEGAGQAAGELIGQGAGAMLKSGANRLYQSVLKPTLAMRAENPSLVKTGLEYAIPVTSGGADKASELMRASKGAADSLVADAASQPGAAMIDPKDAVGGIMPAVKDARNLPVARPMMRAIGDTGRQYLDEHPSPISLTKAQEMVRATDEFFNPTYRATMDRGNPVTSGSTAASMGINNETRQLLRDAVPGLQEQNAKTSALEGVRQAIERRTDQRGNNSVGGMQHLINVGVGAGAGALGSERGHGVSSGAGAFLTMEALTNPAIASRLAIMASHTPTSALTIPPKAASPLVEELLRRLQGDQAVPEQR